MIRTVVKWSVRWVVVPLAGIIISVIVGMVAGGLIWKHFVE